MTGMANSMESVVATIYEALLVLPPKTLKKAYRAMSPDQRASFQSLFERSRSPCTHPAAAQNSNPGAALLKRKENIGRR